MWVGSRWAATYQSDSNLQLLPKPLLQLNAIELKVSMDALCGSYYDAEVNCINFFVWGNERDQTSNYLLKIFRVGIQSEVVAMTLAHCVVWSIRVRVRVWIVHLEHRKLDVVCWVVLTTWTWTKTKIAAYMNVEKFSSEECQSHITWIWIMLWVTTYIQYIIINMSAQ